MISVWSEQLRVGSHDTDFNGNVRPTAMIGYMQEAAMMEFYRTKPTMEQMLADAHRTFLVSRMTLQIYAPLSAHAYITAQSWACPSKHSSFIRCGQVLLGKQTVAQMHSVWALVDTDTRALLRCEDYHPNFGESEPIALPTRFRIPRESGWQTVMQRPVTYHDCDINGHMNNTRYADMLCDCMDMRGKRVSEIMLSYRNEARLGETVAVKMAEADGAYYFCTEKENGEIGIEAKITLCHL